MEGKKKCWDARYAREHDTTVDLKEYTPVTRDALLCSKRILGELGIKNGRILDIAGGTGKSLKFFSLSSRNNELYLVDFSEEAVALARRNGFKAFLCDIENEDLPFEDEYFDLVVVKEIVEHLYSCEMLLREAYRVLKEGGHIYITTPNIAGLIDRIFLLRGKKPLAMGWDETHIRFFTFDGLQDETTKQGFEITTSTTQGAYLCFKTNFIRIPLLAHINKKLGQHIMVLGRK